MSFAWNDYRLDGCIFESKRESVPVLSAPKVNIPQQIDLRKFCSPIEDQKTTSSCVANAVVGALEFHQIKNGLRLTDMSRLFVYYNARAMAGMQNTDSGSQIHHGMAAILAHGACEARMWPFQEAMLTTQPTEACYENAAHYEAVQYARTPRGTPALAALAQGLPVVFGGFWPMDYYKVAAQTGSMPKPKNITPTQPPSGHAMLIVGYDLADKTYLIRNSWGMGFADGGYFKMPFETMDAWSSEEAFWTIGAIEKIKGFSMSGPSVAQSLQALGAFDIEIPTDDFAAQMGGEPRIDTQGSYLDELRTELRSSLSSELESAKRNFRDRLRGKK